MTANKWHGVGGYDYFLTLSEPEMRELADHFKIDWSVFTSSNHFDDSYYCYVSLSRRAIALIPFLAMAFGGQYDESPIGEYIDGFSINYDDYRPEDFNWPERKDTDGCRAKFKDLLKRYF